MTNIPSGYEIGPRERELIKQLELFQRQGVPLTPTAFCERVGLAGTSSIRRYRVLKQMLNDYGWVTQSDKMRGTRVPAVVLPSPDDPRVARLEGRIKRLEDELKATEALKHELKRSRTQLGQARGVLMALVAQITEANAGRAQEVEARLLELALAHAAEQESGGAEEREYRTTAEFLDEIESDWRAE